MNQYFPICFHEQTYFPFKAAPTQYFSSNKSKIYPLAAKDQAISHLKDTTYLAWYSQILSAQLNTFYFMK